MHDRLEALQRRVAELEERTTKLERRLEPPPTVRVTIPKYTGG